MISPPIIAGRGAELERVRQAVTATGGPRVLTIEGEPGIGKTTLWAAGLTVAKGSAMRVLVAQPTEAERAFAFAGLTDLLRSVPGDVVAQLPGPQRDALDVALGRIPPPDGGPDSFTMSLALLALLRLLGEDGPVLLAIDDLQWIDRSSRSILNFALRRLVDGRVGLLATVRATAETSADLDAVLKDRPATRLILGPMPVEALDLTLREHLGAQIALPVVRRIHVATNGNPFYAVELGRSLLASGIRPVAGRPLPVTGSLRDLVRERIASLGEAALEVVLVVAALARPRRTIVEAAVGDVTRYATGVVEAERSGILAMRDEVFVFSHPLLASVAYDATPEHQRRLLHRRLAELVGDEEERAIHLTLAISEADSEVAAEVERAADLARRRGASAVAAEFYESAMRLTPDDRTVERSRYGRLASQYHVASGDAPRARQLLVALSEIAPAGIPRGEVLTQLGNVVCQMGDDDDAIRLYGSALAEVKSDPRLTSDLHTNLAWMTSWRGDTAIAYDHIGKARKAAELAHDDLLLAGALEKQAQMDFQGGRPDALEVAHRAATLLWARDLPLGSAVVYEVQLLTWADELDIARDRVGQMMDLAIERGDERTRAELLVQLTETEFRAGRWNLAEHHAAEGLAIARAAGFDTRSYERVSAMVAVGLGDLAAAHRLADALLGPAKAAGDVWVILRVLSVVGFAEISAGHDLAALQVLTEALELEERMGIVEPGIYHLEANAIEALIGIGDLDRAESLLHGFEERAQQLQRRWALVSAARCRALLRATRGEDAAAVASLDRALALQASLGQPFELGRTLLVAGMIHRRAKRRREARAALTEAIEVFGQVGASVWRDRARAEMARIDGRAPSGDRLTPTELQVVELVASGLSNREVAGKLFMTIRTVESNLTRVYQKLGVQSRMQLARHVNEGGLAQPH